MSTKTNANAQTQANNGKAKGSTDTAADAAESLVKFGKDVYLKACKAAMTAVNKVAGVDEEIASLNSQILVKKEGNASILHKLAIQCVELTAKGKVAVLGDAAILFRDACAHAEEVTVNQFRNAHPEATDAKIRHIVPSWPVLRSDFFNAMAKAAIDPSSAAKPTEVIEAYRKWKDANAGEVGAGGRTPRAGGTRSVSTQEALASAPVSESLIQPLKTAFATLLGTAKGLTEEGQTELADDIMTLAGIYNQKMKDAAKDEVKTKTAPQPEKRAAA